MATHQIAISMPGNMAISKDPLMVEVRADGFLLGEMEMGKAGIDWLPSGNSVNVYRMSWEKLAAMMEESGRKVRLK
jgi:hypothetical protein